MKLNWVSLWNIKRQKGSVWGCNNEEKKIKGTDKSGIKCINCAWESLLASPPSPVPGWLVITVVSHELARQWQHVKQQLLITPLQTSLGREDVCIPTYEVVETCQGWLLQKQLCSSCFREIRYERVTCPSVNSATPFSVDHCGMKLMSLFVKI